MIWLSSVEMQNYKKISYLQSPQDLTWVRLMELFEACSNAKGYLKTRTWLKVNIHKKPERSSVNYFCVWTAYQKQTNASMFSLLCSNSYNFTQVAMILWQSIYIPALDNPFLFWMSWKAQPLMNVLCIAAVCQSWVL